MGIRLNDWIYIRRAARIRRSFAVSSFTIFLLGFSFVYWILDTFSTVSSIECEYAFFWTWNWSSGRSIFQLVGTAIILCVVIWLTRLVIVKNKNHIESVMQLVLIVGLAGAFVAQKSYLFPFATPTRVEVARVASIFFPMNPLLEESEGIEINLRSNWKYDYPPPPFASRPERPAYNRDINLRLQKIFKSSNSPRSDELFDVRTCVNDYHRAIGEYQRNIETWDLYWENFDDWYALNRLRYSE